MMNLQVQEKLAPLAQSELLIYLKIWFQLLVVFFL